MSEHPKAVLSRYGLEPKRSLGQNFLFDSNILTQIVDAADVRADDEILEIGPGLGSLTYWLAQRAGRVVAVELDERLLPALEGELYNLDHVEIVHGDILEQDPAALFEGSYKVVANVPYYITGAILRFLLSGTHKPAVMVMTVQKEVADRLTAEPPLMSLLGVSVQYYGRVERVATIKAGAFWPRPDVDSTVIRITLHQQDSVDAAQERLFFRVVRAGFSQKRKQLQKNLRQLGIDRTAVRTALEKAQIDGARRAETLSLAEWQALARALDQKER